MALPPKGMVILVIVIGWIGIGRRRTPAVGVDAAVAGDGRAMAHHAKAARMVVTYFMACCMLRQELQVCKMVDTIYAPFTGAGY